MPANGTAKGGGREAPKPANGGNPTNRILVALLLAMLGVNLRQQSLSMEAAGRSAHTHLRTSIDGWDDPSSDRDDEEEEDEATAIIRKSYERSYGRILPCDDLAPLGSGAFNPKFLESNKRCMKRTLDHFLVNKNNSTIEPIPWWFQTLLRDLQSNGAYGFWHHFYTSEPAFNFCTIEKVATTEWRKLFCKLNADECVNDTEGRCKLRGGVPCAWRTHREMPEDAPWAVFVRDPLERLLSGYLDKCHKPVIRKNEGHCQPNVVFNPAPDLQNANGKSYPSLLQNLEGSDKQMFNAYLDVLPLTWNIHFVPQAIACDLHRAVDKFDFVGNMGPDFMFDLERMANQFGGQLPEVLNSTFGYMDRVAAGRKNNTGKEQNRHATHAPAKVAEFYTAETVRRGLELLSVDYVTLGLEVPGWARQMLRDDAR